MKSGLDQRAPFLMGAGIVSTNQLDEIALDLEGDQLQHVRQVLPFRRQFHGLLAVSRFRQRHAGGQRVLPGRERGEVALQVVDVTAIPSINGRTLLDDLRDPGNVGAIGESDPLPALSAFLPGAVVVQPPAPKPTPAPTPTPIFDSSKSQLLVAEGLTGADFV